MPTIYSRNLDVELRGDDLLVLTFAEIEQSEKQSWLLSILRGLAFVVLLVVVLFSAGAWIGTSFFTAWIAYEMFHAGNWVGGSVVGTFAACVMLLPAHLFLREVCSAGLWFHFDRQNRRISQWQRPLGFWRKPRPVESWNFADVSAIELRYGGTEVKTHVDPDMYGSPGSGSTRTTRRHYYEFNLMLSDPASEQKRITLVATHRWKWMRAVAPKIGEFTGLPVHDHLHRGAARP